MEKEIKQLPQKTSTVKDTKGVSQKEEYYEMSEEKLKELNDYIHKCIICERDYTNYELLYLISRGVIENIREPYFRIQKNEKYFSKEQTIKIALEFYKNLDKELYEKVKNIIEGKSDIRFKIYNYDPKSDSEKVDDEGLPIYSKTPMFLKYYEKKILYLPCNETIEDVYVLIHELAHTLDYVKNDNFTRNFLTEVTPNCVEVILRDYLLKNKIVSLNDNLNSEKEKIFSLYDTSLNTLAKLELIFVKLRNKEIKQEDIINLQKKYGINNNRVKYILDDIMKSRSNVYYGARYMVSRYSLSVFHGTV